MTTMNGGEILAPDTVHPTTEPEDHQYIAELAQHRLAVITTPSCPFCHRVKMLLQDLKLEYHEIQAVPGTPTEEMFNRIATKLDYGSVPMVFVHGKFIGGCDATCAKCTQGELQRLLDLPSYDRPITEGEGRKEPGFTTAFMFPSAVNRWIVQGVGIQVCILSVLLIIFRNEHWVGWVCLGMAADFGVRVIAGATPSVLGANALFLTSWMEEEMVPGTPKQFASLIGAVLYGIATLFFLIGGPNGLDTGKSGSASEIGGSITLGIVALFSFLEGFFNFCAGCWVFGYFVKWGWVRADIYAPYTDTYATVMYTLDFFNYRAGWGEAPKSVEEGSVVAHNRSLFGWRTGRERDPAPRTIKVHTVPIKGEERTVLDVPYHYPKTCDTVKEGWHIKYIGFADFGMVVGIGGLAIAFDVVRNERYVPQEVWMVLALIAGCIYGLLMMAMAYKLVFHSRKIYSDLTHQMKRNQASVMFIGALILAYLVRDYDRNLMELLWWFGAVGNMLHSTVVLAMLIKNYTFTEFIHPAIMVPPGTNLVAAMIAPYMGSHYAEWGRWFFGVGFFFYFILLTGTMMHGFTDIWPAEGHRAGVMMWMGLTGILVPVYQDTFQVYHFDAFCYTMFCAMIMLFLVNLYLIYPGRFLLGGRFTTMNWGMAFPVDVVIFACARYHHSEQTRFAEGLMYVAFIFATWGVYSMSFHTLHVLARRQWPRSMPKFGPSALLRVQHEAFRILVNSFRAEARRLRAATATSNPTSNQMARIRRLWQQYDKFYRLHSGSEMLLYEELAGVNAQHTQLAIDHHAELRSSLDAVGVLLDAKTELPLCHTLGAALDAHCTLMIDTIQWEEDHIQHGLVVKNLNVEIQLEVMKRCFESVPREEWQHAAYMMARYCPTQMHRLRALRALMWAVPMHAKMIGSWVYRGLAMDPLGEVKWAYLVAECPEMEPKRHEWFYRRSYRAAKVAPEPTELL